MKRVLTFLFLAAALDVKAQVVEFCVDINLCAECGSFDSTKYSREQVMSTLDLGFRSFNYGNIYPYFNRFETRGDVLFDTAMVANKQKLQRTIDFEFNELDKEYKILVDTISKLNLLPTPYWQTFRKQKLDEFKDVYEVKKAVLMAYKHIGPLANLYPEDTLVTEFANALIEGGDRLIKAWKKTIELMGTKDYDPEPPELVGKIPNWGFDEKRLQTKFDKENASPNRMIYAFVEVLKYGWWHYADKRIRYAPTSNWDEFKKFMLSWKVVACD